MIRYTTRDLMWLTILVGVSLMLSIALLDYRRQRNELQERYPPGSIVISPVPPGTGPPRRFRGFGFRSRLARQPWIEQRFKELTEERAANQIEIHKGVESVFPLPTKTTLPPRGSCYHCHSQGFNEKGELLEDAV